MFSEISLIISAGYGWFSSHDFSPGGLFWSGRVASSEPVGHQLDHTPDTNSWVEVSVSSPSDASSPDVCALFPAFVEFVALIFSSQLCYQFPDDFSCLGQSRTLIRNHLPYFRQDFVCKILLCLVCKAILGGHLVSIEKFSSICIPSELAIWRCSWGRWTTNGRQFLQIHHQRSHYR